MKDIGKKKNKNINEIKIEISKNDWLKNKELLCSEFPELYEF